MVELRICAKCNIIKELNSHNFKFRKDRGYYNTFCKDCATEYRLRRAEDIKRGKININLIPKDSEVYIDNVLHKLCQTCKEVKLLEYFYFQKTKSQYRSACKECLSNYEKLNRDKINKRNRERYYNDPNYKCRAIISRQIWNYLYKNSIPKDNKIFEVLNYSKEDLRLHIESLFESWMNWSNYGRYSKYWDDDNLDTWRWQIDHIIPASKFKYDSLFHTDFKKCWALGNLRPLSAKENNLKSNMEYDDWLMKDIIA